MTDLRKRPTERQIDDARLAEQLLTGRRDTGDPFAAAIHGTRMAMVVTDPRQNDNPVVFANNAFCQLTGYDRREVIGRNCRMLQGPDTSRRELRRLRMAIANEEDVHVELMNYRKDGTPFWNSLFVSPVRDGEGRVIYFFGSQIDVSGKKQTESDLHSVNDELRETKNLLEQQIDDRTTELMRLLTQRSRLVNELDHRVKNNLQLINSLLGFELRRDLGEEAREVVTRLHHRIDALGMAHKDQHNKDAIGYFRVDNFIRILVGKIIASHPDWHAEPHYELDEISLPIAKAAPLSLALNEFVRSLLSHTDGDNGAGEDARLAISVQAHNETLTISAASEHLTHASCDRAAQAVESWTRQLLENQLDARLEFFDGEDGCGMRITMPLNGIYYG